MPLEAIKLEAHETKRKERGVICEAAVFTLYAAMFHLFRVFPVQKKRVALISMHNADFHDGLGEVERAFQGKRKAIFYQNHAPGSLPANKCGPGRLFALCLSCDRFFTRKAYGLARSRYIFLNDNFMPLASLHLGKRWL